MPTPIPPVQIRCATREDLPAINDIYNYYVLNSTCTYQEQPEPMHDRHAWFAAHGPAHPITVARMPLARQRTATWRRDGRMAVVLKYSVVA